MCLECCQRLAICEKLLEDLHPDKSEAESKKAHFHATEGSNLSEEHHDEVCIIRVAVNQVGDEQLDEPLEAAHMHLGGL